MRLTFDLKGTITYLHPNQLDNERAFQPSLCSYVLANSVCVHVYIYIFVPFRLFARIICVCLKPVKVCVLMSAADCVCWICLHVEIGFTSSKGRGRAACYWRRITEQYWSGRGHPLPILSLVFPANAHHFLSSSLFGVNISLTAIISTLVTTATASGTRADNSP